MGSRKKMKKSTKSLPRRRSAPKARSGTLAATNRVVANFPSAKTCGMREMLRRAILTQVTGSLRRDNKGNLKKKREAAKRAALTLVM